MLSPSVRFERRPAEDAHSGGDFHASPGALRRMRGCFENKLRIAQPSGSVSESGSGLTPAAGFRYRLRPRSRPRMYSCVTGCAPAREGLFRKCRPQTSDIRPQTFSCGQGAPQLHEWLFSNPLTHFSSRRRTLTNAPRAHLHAACTAILSANVGVRRRPKNVSVFMELCTSGKESAAFCALLFETRWINELPPGCVRISARKET